MSIIIARHRIGIMHYAFVVNEHIRSPTEFMVPNSNVHLVLQVQGNCSLLPSSKDREVIFVSRHLPTQLLATQTGDAEFKVSISIALL